MMGLLHSMHQVAVYTLLSVQAIQLKTASSPEGCKKPASFIYHGISKWFEWKKQVFFI